MRANSTQISNRMFKTQRMIIMVIATMLILLLVITSLAGHHEKVINQVKSYTDKASESLSGFYKPLDKSPSSESQEEAQKEGVKENQD